MYCPRCGTENIEDARFCRGCGADIGLVSQALSGHLPETRSVGDEVADKISRSARRHSRKNTPRLDKAISTGCTGLAFLIVAIVLSRTPMGRFWWFWMLIPAFTMIGGGIAEYVRFKQAEQKTTGLPERERARTAMPPPARVSALPPRNTSELVPPPSVTEGTTRHLDIKAEAPTRHINTPVEKPAKDS